MSLIPIKEKGCRSPTSIPARRTGVAVVTAGPVAPVAAASSSAAMLDMDIFAAGGELAGDMTDRLDQFLGHPADG